MEEEKKIIEAERRVLEQTLRFFSNDVEAQAERERWVVGEFLSKLGITFSYDELISPPQADEVDVAFRDARFQVKEIYDPRERRYAELKEDLRRAETAKKLHDLYGKVETRDNRYVDVLPIIEKFASDPKYTPSWASTDLLCYVTRTDATIEKPAQVSRALQHWRSVSCLFGSKPIILATQVNAPSFLKV